MLFCLRSYSKIDFSRDSTRYFFIGYDFFYSGTMEYRNLILDNQLGELRTRF